MDAGLRRMGGGRTTDPRLRARQCPDSRHPSCGSEPGRLNPDFVDLLRALYDSGARFLVVGAQAMAAHGVPRATGDMEVWVEPTEQNASAVWQALSAFGAPLEAFGLAVRDFAAVGNVVQIGVPPRRVDLMTSIDGVAFGTAWDNRFVVDVGHCRIPFLGRADLMRKQTRSGPPEGSAGYRAAGRGGGWQAAPGLNVP